MVLDANGSQLLSVPVVPLAAALSGNDLVILRQGELLDFDAATGTQTHAAAPRRRERPRMRSSTAVRPSPTAPVRPTAHAQDAARGLVAYVLDGQVHLLRLSDGKDEVVGAGRLARFMDAGLVYADGSRLHLVPFAALPLH